MDYRTEDYEKTFIEKYLERAARDKIEEMERKVERQREAGNVEKVLELEKRIEKIREELAADKATVLEGAGEKKDVESTEMVDFGWEASGDDGDAHEFQSRCERGRKAYCKQFGVAESSFDENMKTDVEMHRGVSIPGFLWRCLFPYQQEGVKWLLGLYRNGKGGVLADDMGLGKTVQIIGFLAALFSSRVVNRVLILSPATVVPQWLSEWKRFYPFIRIFMGFTAPESDGVCLMSYERFKMSGRSSLWDILILDEGHRIKNRSAQITLAAKKLRAEYKFVLSGTPIQNNLGELWSIFDFVNPGLLGSYTSFYEEFEEVISQGGYKNASASQVDKSYRQSLVLRSLIDSYILRRSKTQVSHKLPSKTDKIIFCSLTAVQIQQYNRVLESKHIMNVMEGKASLLSGISMLRKICNHPRLLLSKTSGDARLSVELVESSCKIEIMLGLLEKWKREENKVLIFSQTVEMLNIIEECIGKYRYLRMDGNTPTSSRPGLVSRFNGEDDVFIFLLTTRVGGLGLNLTGASRIVIYDPDWNPSTDTQAKERAWRYGQRKDVEIYRFVCKDTIEEKIYQKQIFKDLLGKKVLSNPRLNRFFNKSCVDELFSFAPATSGVDIKVHEAEQAEGQGALKEVRKEDSEAFLRMKFLNEKKTLSGAEVLEYIRLRECAFE